MPRLKKGARNGLVLMSILGIVFLGWYLVNYTNTLESIAPQAAGSENRPSSRSGFSLGDMFGKDDTIKVCVVTWGGYAGGEYFNGGFGASEDSRYFREYGLKVEFEVMDAFLPSRDAWKNGECDLLWATVDAFTTEAANLLNAGYYPDFIFQADWSRGGDAIVVARGIESMNDLVGKRISVAYGTPSHTFLLRMIEAANKSVDDFTLIDTGDAIEAANVFKANQSDAAVVWSPDDDACIRARSGSKVLVSTEQAKYIIADGFFVKQELLDERFDDLRNLVEGWLIGNAEINTNSSAKQEASRILARGLGISEADAMAAINNVRLATFEDNLLFFGLKNKPGYMTAERLFRESGLLYQASGYRDLVPMVPNFGEVSDLRILQSIQLRGEIHAAEGSEQFTAPKPEDRKAQEIASKPLTVTFPTGSATLSNNAKNLIDIGFVPTAQAFAGARIRIEGNTDNTGSRSVNMTLSLRRAQAIADYLSQEHGFDRNRFIVVGNGPDNPVCTTSDDACLQQNRRTDFELIR